ncbi:hypothetical protein BU14_0244s0007 [Porphyra umbilicalis]|uniref:Uncharacterized protein n=1 Tax=Porphyra umbilicalis TaxID=2786 RepID=A0A1X6P3A8_PORUM|nr:hypothetical protein BU14_0244s0007 [Porphyra umbilicalis]|eukprot:OSX75245.1 hypothetical protein BU14_0244s0007 [Porphyra umbilicalis]
MSFSDGGSRTPRTCRARNGSHRGCGRTADPRRRLVQTVTAVLRPAAAPPPPLPPSPAAAAAAAAAAAGRECRRRAPRRRGGAEPGRMEREGAGGREGGERRRGVWRCRAPPTSVAARQRAANGGAGRLGPTAAPLAAQNGHCRDGGSARGARGRPSADTVGVAVATGWRGGGGGVPRGPQADPPPMWPPRPPAGRPAALPRVRR